MTVISREGAHQTNERPLSVHLTHHSQCSAHLTKQRPLSPHLTNVRGHHSPLTLLASDSATLGESEAVPRIRKEAEGSRPHPPALVARSASHREPRLLRPTPGPLVCLCLAHGNWPLDWAVSDQSDHDSIWETVLKNSWISFLASACCLQW